MQRTSKSWTSGDPATAVEFNKIRDDFDELFVNGSERLKVFKLTTDGALVVRVGAGTYRVGGTEGQYAGGTVTVGATNTTYIMIDSAGAIQTSTSAWNSAYTRLGVVISSAGTITSITPWRNDAVGGVLGGLTFVDTQGSNTTPNDYNDQTFKAQLKTITNIGLNGIATGTYARLIGFRGQTSSTYGLSHEIAYCDDGIYQRTGSTTTWGSWVKSTSPTFGTEVSVSGIPTTSTLLSRGGFITAVGSAVNNTASETAIIAIQTSPDNSTWTDLVTATVAGNFKTPSGVDHNPSISAFIAPGLYVRANLTGTCTYKLTINANIQPFS